MRRENNLSKFLYKKKLYEKKLKNIAIKVAIKEIIL